MRTDPKTVLSRADDLVNAIATECALHFSLEDRPGAQTTAAEVWVAALNRPAAKGALMAVIRHSLGAELKRRGLL